MSDIPTQVYREILLRLPAESLFRFRVVCKSWRRIIDDPSFIRSHTKNQHSSTTLLIRNIEGSPIYSLSLDSLDYIDSLQTIYVTRVKTLMHRGVPRLPTLPVASCNGLILISHYDIDKKWVIWNPLTWEFHELPNINTDLHLLSTGLGYDYVSDDYKVVRIDKFYHHGKSACRTLVYSLKMNSWRKIRNCPREVWWQGHGVFSEWCIALESRAAGEMIIALDFGTEYCWKISFE